MTITSPRRTGACAASPSPCPWRRNWPAQPTAAHLARCDGDPAGCAGCGTGSIRSYSPPHAMLPRSRPDTVAMPAHRHRAHPHRCRSPGRCVGWLRSTLTHCPFSCSSTTGGQSRSGIQLFPRHTHLPSLYHACCVGYADPGQGKQPRMLKPVTTAYCPRVDRHPSRGCAPPPHPVVTGATNDRG